MSTLIQSETRSSRCFITTFTKEHVVQKITKIGVVSLAKIMGMSGLIFGLIAGVVYGGILILMGIIGASGGQGENTGFALAGIGVGLAMMIFVPVAYGIMSFIVGLIYGLIINVVLAFAGGLELEIRSVN